MNLEESKAVPHYSRLFCFDIAKGIGIFLVIIGHVVLSSQRYIYSFHMPLFFLISGYFLSCKDSLPNYVYKRTKQLMLPYLLTAAAGTAAMLLYGCMSDCGLSCGQILEERTLANLYGLGWYYTVPFIGKHVQMAGTLWFLPALLFSLLTVRLSLKFEYPFIFVIVVSTLAYLSARVFLLPLSVQGGINASLFVYIGYIARKCGFIQSRTYSSWWAIVISALIWGISVYKFGGMGINLCSYPNYFVNSFAAICMSYLLIRFCMLIERIEIAKNVLSYIGKNTLFIFCFHAFTQAAFWSFSPEFHIHPMTWGNAILRIMFYLVSPIIALLVKDFVMRQMRK